MGFLGRFLGGTAPDAHTEEDIARLAQGGIPLSAEQRVRELGGGGMAFTSGLSVSDFALSQLDAVRPVCQVMGCTTYQVGWQNYPWQWSRGAGMVTELRQLTDAWNHAWALALGRLAEEARLAGCHAVVDVVFSANRHEFLSGEIEIVVNGTAVHLPEGGDEPVLTDLSLPDFTLLRRAGYRPVGVVTSTSVFYIVPSQQTRRATAGWQRFQPNQELTDFTQGVYAAREMALARAGDQAARLSAGGLVGVDIKHELTIREVDNGGKREDLIVTFHILGTAIAPSGRHLPLDPSLILRQGAT